MASKASAENLVTDPADIGSLLAALYRQKTPVTVMFSGNKHPYVSLVVDLDRDKQFFLLDELNPPSGHALLLSGRSFSVRSSEQGLAVFFSGCKLLKLIKDKKGALYKVAFPQLVQHNQKRQAFRAHVLESMQAPVTLRAYERKSLLQGRLVDMSHGGCNLSLPLPINPPIKEMEIFEELTLKVEGFDKELTVAAEVRHLKTHKDGKTLDCGLRFINLKGSLQAEVDRLVMFLQREALRLDSSRGKAL